ncbi:hypothetical protein EUA93_16365 [Nocardioides oleivorans]|uniref:M23ase beta-sheet core domain-containing protein n=1 Tax=Nocardioides oleivorans TaxID=273676 RepID=A0A4Q2RW33_9ACTN|nr:peptidoglycan DD-metalloendopeptidase family protein [Nocardioides oleivorans]RYB91723.1 hypothetical protein EUA93_16365 [Nocardioides oleivorans]
MPHHMHSHARRLVVVLSALLMAALASLTALSANAATVTSVSFGRVKPGAGITQGYSSGHSGIDFAGGQAAALASASGYVVALRSSQAGGNTVSSTYSGYVPSQASGGCWGNYVGILHGGNSAGTPVISWYGHLASTNLILGQSVSIGQTVGTAGQSSYTSCGVSGVHLHYSVTVGARAFVNPTPYYGTADGNKTVSMQWQWVPPTSAVQASIQQKLTDKGYYTGPVNGIWGPASVQAVQAVVRDRAGYTGSVNGIPGPGTATAVQNFAKARGGYTGPINAVPGANTWSAFLTGLNGI